MFWIANLKTSLCFANHSNGQAESNVISKNDMAFLEMTVLGCFFFLNDMFWIANLKMSLCIANHTMVKLKISKNMLKILI